MPFDSPHFPQAEAYIAREVAFVVALESSGLPVPHFHATSNGDKYVTAASSNSLLFITLMNCIPGNHPIPDVRTVEATAALQVKLHSLSRTTSSDLFPPSAQYSALAHRQHDPVETFPRDFPVRLLAELQSVAGTISPEIKAYFFSHCQQPIHGDTTVSNLLFTSPSVVSGLLDFGDARCSVVAEDLGIFIWDVADRVEPLAVTDLTLRYLSQYARLCPLSRLDQRTALFYAIDRYLAINTYYLLYHRSNQARLADQAAKATRQLGIAHQLLAVAHRLR